jgi:hypothetical protein
MPADGDGRIPDVSVRRLVLPVPVFIERVAVNAQVGRKVLSRSPGVAVVALRKGPIVEGLQSGSESLWT